MKQRTLFILLAAEAAVCGLLCTMPIGVMPDAAAILTFPFAQLAQLMRALSCWNAFGRGLALMLYVAVCAAPVYLALCFKGYRGLRAWDALFLAAGALSFLTVYMLLNPAKLALLIPDAWAQSGTEYAAAGYGAALCAAVWSLIICGVLIRAVKASSAGDTKRVCGYARALLYAMCFVFVYAAFGAELSGMISSIKALGDNTAATAPDYVFTALSFAVAALPWVLDTLAAIMASRLIAALGAPEGEANACEEAGRLARFCARALIITALSAAAFNVAQLVCAKLLVNVSTSAQIPLASLLITLSALLFARLVEENRTLREDNALFI